MKREINECIIHCSASGPHTTRDDIKRWHKQKGFTDIGYHYVIEYDGSIKLGRSIDEPGAHCKDHNSDTVGICLVGGYDGKKLHHFSQSQLRSLDTIIEGLRLTYGNIPVVGHHQYNHHKTCPCFDVHKYMEDKTMVYIK